MTSSIRFRRKKLALVDQKCTILDESYALPDMALHQATAGQLPEDSLPEDQLSGEPTREAVTHTARDKRDELRRTIAGDANSPITEAEQSIETMVSMSQLDAMADLEEQAGLVITRDQVDFAALDRALADPSLSREDVVTAAFAPAAAAMILGDLARAKELDRRQMLAASGAAVAVALTGSSAEAANKGDAPAARIRPADPMPEKISYEWHGIEDRDLVHLTDTERLMYELTMTDPAFQNAKTEQLVRDHKTMYRNKDVAKWKELVKQLELDKLRETFLGEYLAFSGETVCAPIEGIGPEPREGVKHHGYSFHAYRADRTKDGKFFSDRLTSTSYVLVKGNVPIRDNPYALVSCCALKNFSPGETEKFLEGLRKLY